MDNIPLFIIIPNTNEFSQGQLGLLAKKAELTYIQKPYIISHLKESCAYSFVFREQHFSSFLLLYGLLQTDQHLSFFSSPQEYYILSFSSKNMFFYNFNRINVQIFLE